MRDLDILRLAWAVAIIAGFGVWLLVASLVRLGQATWRWRPASMRAFECRGHCLGR